MRERQHKLSIETFVTEITNRLDETVTPVPTDIDGAFRVRLNDGIIITKMGDSLFTEDGVNDWTESEYGVWEELDADIAAIRSQVVA